LNQTESLLNKRVKELEEENERLKSHLTLTGNKYKRKWKNVRNRNHRLEARYSKLSYKYRMLKGEMNLMIGRHEQEVERYHKYMLELSGLLDNYIKKNTNPSSIFIKEFLNEILEREFNE